MGKVIDIVGQRFGNLTVVSFSHIDKNHKSHWNCQCDCGNSVVLQKSNFAQGNTVSCGCYRRKNTTRIKKTHGKSKTRLYNIYRGMRARCFNHNSEKYKLYGGRGITICNEWMGKDGFECFYAWAVKNGYSDNLSIDRIDNNGDYSPQNCRWATAKEQALNTRVNTKYYGYGLRLSGAEWASALGIHKTTFYRRIKRGIDVEHMKTSFDKKELLEKARNL